MSEKQAGKHCVDYVNWENEEQKSPSHLHKGLVQSAVERSKGSWAQLSVTSFFWSLLLHSTYKIPLLV